MASVYHRGTTRSNVVVRVRQPQPERQVKVLHRRAIGVVEEQLETQRPRSHGQVTDVPVINRVVIPPIKPLRDMCAMPRDHYPPQPPLRRVPVKGVQEEGGEGGGDGAAG